MDVITKEQKRRARESVKRAVKTGKLIRPDRCDGCGSRASVEAHHPNYAMPLDVEWLCHDCHALWHEGAEDMDDTQFRWAFKKSEIVQGRYEDQSAYWDWRNWPPN